MFWVIVWLASAGLGYAIGNSKGRAAQGLVLGLLLGVIGVIIIAVMKPSADAPGQASGAFGAGSVAGAGWQRDPYGRHEYRYWNGGAWTDSVSDQGEQKVDALGALPSA